MIKTRKQKAWVVPALPTCRVTWGCWNPLRRLQVGTPLVMMPNAQRCKVTTVWRDDDEVQAAGPGENLRIRISGIDEDQVRPRRVPITSSAQWLTVGGLGP